MEALLLGAMPLAMMWLMEGLARSDLGAVARWAVNAPFAFAITWVMMLGVCLVLCIFRRRRIRYILSVCLLAASAFIGVASRYKMRYRLEPVLFSDIYQLGDALTTVRNMDFSIDIWEILLLCALTVVGLALSLWVRRRTKRRWGLAAIGLALLIALPGLCTFERSSDITRYDLADHAYNEGVWYTALAVENQRRELMRVDYGEEAVRQTYRDLAGKAPAAAGEQPNIILVLSESFADDAWLSKYLDLTRDLTPFYDSLITTCLSGQLAVPKVGGGTSETEFEVLTGLESRYALNPYARGLPSMHSLASVLREKGYHTSALHWYAGVYYNRYNNLQNLGFDEFCTTDTTNGDFEKIGMFISDTDHYDAVLEQLDRTEERDFIFLLTMQNHGGYEYDDFRQTYGADVPFTNQLTARSGLGVNNYCYLVQQSDRALEAFISQLTALEEPTMLAYFSDHIPPFGVDAWAELGIPTTGEESHLTPYFIWSNVENTPERLDMESWQLGAYLLSAAGQGDDPFFAHVESLRQSGQGSDDAYDLLSYDALFGDQYAYQEGGLSPRNEAFEIGGDMVLLGFETAQIADAIYVRPALERPEQKCKLEINGQAVDIPCISPAARNLTLAAVMTSYNADDYNRTETRAFADANALLAESAPLPVETIDLSALTFELSSSSGRLDILRSAEAVPSSFATALVSGGERWQWQPVYGLTRAGQYGVDDDGHLCIAVSPGDSVPQDAVLHLVGPR